jgi:hypothetical protein
MTYNITVKNKGALPIPYITKCGEQMAVDSLYSKKDLFCDALFIGATGSKQLLIHCTTVDYIVDPTPDLEIEFHVKEPVSTTN